MMSIRVPHEIQSNLRRRSLKSDFFFKFTVAYIPYDISITNVGDS